MYMDCQWQNNNIFYCTRIIEFCAYKYYSKENVVCMLHNLNYVTWTFWIITCRQYVTIELYQCPVGHWGPAYVFSCELGCEYILKHGG